MNKPDSSPITLLVITVNYFSANLVESLLEQLLQQTLPIGTSMSVVCADNSQSLEEHQSLKTIKDAFDSRENTRPQLNFELVFNSANLGYGSAINRSAKDRNFDFICCINPDVTLKNQALHELLSHANENPNEGIWGGLTVDQQLNPDFRHAWQKPTLLNTFTWATGLKRLSSHPALQDNYRHLANQDPPYPVDNVSGCFMLISANAWQSTQGFDTDFFLYSEEIDLCKRAKKVGFQPTVVPASKLHHWPHSQEVSRKRLHQVYTSKFLYIQKHHGLAYCIAYRANLFLASMIRATISLVQMRFEAAKVWAKLAFESIFYRSNRALDRDTAQ